MLKWILRIALVLVVVAAVAFWWLLMGSKAPRTAEGVIDVAAYRSLVAGDATDTLPTGIRIETVGMDLVPSYATEAGWFAGERRLSYTALQIVYPTSTVVIGGAADASTADEMAQSDMASFDQEAYDRIVAALPDARHVLITHEHLDHVMAIARHPEPETIAPKLRLNAAQLARLPEHAPNGVLSPVIAAITPLAADGPARISPGLVVIPMPGHTKGNQTFYLRTQDGNEYFLIGDIVWMMHNLDTLRSRPRLLEVVFKLGEDRKAVQRQVRALHDLRIAEPDLIIVPSHDADYLDGLIAQGRLVDGFVVRE